MKNSCHGARLLWRVAKPTHNHTLEDITKLKKYKYKWHFHLSRPSIAIFFIVLAGYSSWTTALSYAA
jgi:hypothetical protein